MSHLSDISTFAGRVESSRRWIREHYELRTIVDAGQVVGYEAISFALDGKTISDRVRGTCLADVCREARCRWGHFNFRYEAEEFSKIFPAGGAS